MKEGLFIKHSAQVGNPKWESSIKREKDLYRSESDLRSEFYRDYTRILHSTAYRRLKHKTQVFFATRNDHICTRMEHVNHVASVSYTIAKYLGLNLELVNTIAVGHDLGHSPFGHVGETIIRKIVEQHEIGKQGVLVPFWHERNGLRFVDKVITLEDHRGKKQNLNLTYAVRDGIISHCGEVKAEALFPRDEMINLESFKTPSQFEPFTWEGCVVKASDKIAYLGRDIEDATTIGLISIDKENDLRKMIKSIINVDMEKVNNTNLIHHFIVNICKNSSPEEGIRFSTEYVRLIDEIKKFNIDQIYHHPRLSKYAEYASMVINSIFDTLAGFYCWDETLDVLLRQKEFYPQLSYSFYLWLKKFSDVGRNTDEYSKYENKVLYNMTEWVDYLQAIIDYISAMTDSYAIKLFNEITSF